MNQFYLQVNRKNISANIFWCKKGGNTTTDLSKAEVFTRNEAFEKHHNFEAFIPWPKGYVDSKVMSVVEMNSASIKTAYNGIDVDIRVPGAQQPEICRCGAIHPYPPPYSEPRTPFLGGSTWDYGRPYYLFPNIVIVLELTIARDNRQRIKRTCF